MLLCGMPGLFASTIQACCIRRLCLTISSSYIPDSSPLSDGSASTDVSDNEVNDNDGWKEETSPVAVVLRNNRPSRACTVRAATRLYVSSLQQMSKGKQHQQQEQKQCQVVKKDEDDELLEVLQQRKFGRIGEHVA